MHIRLHPLFEGDSGGNTGGGGGTPPPAAPPAPADPLAAFERLLNRSGSDGTQLARQLYEENFRHREQIRTLQGQLPAQGAAVLTPEQATAWQAYQALGAPDQVQATIAGHAALKRDLELRDVASASGYTLDVLRTLSGDLAFEVKDETKDGKAVKAVYVTPKGGQPTPIETYATEQWAAFLPALRPAAAAAAGAPALGASNPASVRGATPLPATFDPKNPPRLSSIDWKK